jgi:hypothetical protein
MASFVARGKSVRAEICVQGRRSSKTFPTRALAEAWAARHEMRVAGMPALKAALSDHRLSMALSPRLRAAVDLCNYTHDEIASVAFPLDSECGVYFLTRGSDVYYVGQTTNLLYRLYKHRKNGRKFDGFAFIPCAPEELDRLESAYIAMLLPGENQRL